jgi:mRNA interferase MazF
MRKTRPALIVQNDIGNRVSPITIVAAISSQVPDRPSPVEVLVAPDEGGLHVRSVILLNYLYSLDRRRLLRRLGALRPSTVAQINRALAVSLGLVDL